MVLKVHALLCGEPWLWLVGTPHTPPLRLGVTVRRVGPQAGILSGEGIHIPSFLERAYAFPIDCPGTAIGETNRLFLHSYAYYGPSTVEGRNQ